VAAGVKVSVLTSAIACSPKSVALFSENTSDIMEYTPPSGQ
jgi:hypothetical protein